MVFIYKATKINVEFVDAPFYFHNDPRVDFNVNNLKIKLNGDNTLNFVLKNSTQQGVGLLTDTESDCRKKQLRLLKPSDNQNMTYRINKMLKRGWKLKTSV